MSRELYYLKPRRQRRFYLLGALRRLGQQEFIAQLGVGIAAVEKGALKLRVPRDGVFYIGGEHAAAGAALNELIAADVVGV